MRKTLLWSGAGIATLVALLLAALGWLLFTTSGARWAAELATSKFAPQVSYASLDGTVAGGLQLREFQFKGPPDAASIRIASLSVTPTLRMLLSRTLRIENARVRGLVLTLPAQPAPDEPDKPLWVRPPLDVVVDDFELLDGRIVKAGETLFAVRQLGVAATWRAEELRIARITLLPGDIAGRLHVQGRVVPSGQWVRGDIDARWDDVVIPEKYAGQVIATAGKLHFEGTPQAYETTSDFTAGPPGEPTRVSLDVVGTDARADIRRLTLEQRAGRLTVNGGVEFEPVAWRLSVNARDFNPGELAAGWPGRINLEARTRGALRDAGPEGSLDIASLTGDLRGRPLAGTGSVEFAAPSRLAGDLRLSSGRSRVAVKGTSGDEIDATVTLAIASLDDWLPHSAGSLNGDFRVGGRWPALTIDGTAEGRGLSFAENRIKRLRVGVEVKSLLEPEGSVRAHASGMAAAGLTFATVELRASGNQKSHRLSVAAEGDQLQGSVEVKGALADGEALNWRGEVSRLSVDTPDLEPLRLQAPMPVTYEAGNVSVGHACLVQEGASLCVEGGLQQSGAMRVAYTFDRVPLALANALAPSAMPGRLRGELAGKGEIRREADGAWFGDASITSPSAELIPGEGGEAATVLGERTLLIYENLQLQASLRGTVATGSLSAALQNGGRLRATLDARDLTAAAPGLDGRVEAHLPTLAPFGAFVPTVANLDGAVDAVVLIRGTLAAPEITGNVDAQRLQADLGNLGIELRDGRVRGEARAGGGFTLAASVASGKGHVELAGTMSERGAIDARIRGQNFQAADIPAANVIVTPDLTLTGDPKGYLLSGEMTIPRADINIERMPQGKAPGASPDVVVVRDGKVVESAAQEEALPISAAVKVKLGDKIAVTGFGLEATVSGELDVRESPGVPTTGSGQLLVAGTFKKYGQDLTVKDGRLLFAGTPLDNPRLAIVAMREIDDDLQTGIRIAGSAKQPVITVISDPEVGEADALSYLVTGRSLNDVGSASGSSQDALASATQSLEGAGAGLVAKRIGQRLGLDEASVEENEMIGGSALTVGEYLSPRLYLSYGVGLFEPGEVIGLRYKLTDDVGVRVQRGNEETRAGIEYRIEK